MTTATARKHHIKIELIVTRICLIVSICDCPILLVFYNFGKVRYNWSRLCAVKLNTEN